MPQPYKNKVEIKEKTEEIENLEYPDAWWYRVYLGVVISNIVVILALWSFTKYFSV